MHAHSAFFVIFRLLVLLFLVNSMFKLQSSVPHWVFCAGTICGIVVLVLSLILLYRLIRSDFGHIGDEDGRGKEKDDQEVGSAESNGCMTAIVAAGHQMSAASGDPNLKEPGSVQHSLSKKIS